MLDDLEIEKQIQRAINHDVYLQLSKEEYGKGLTEYECMLFNFIAIGRECINTNNVNPSILIFGYEKDIICNRQFKVSFSPEIEVNGTNIRLEFIKDMQSERIYYMLQSKINPDRVLFHWLAYTIPIENCGHKDFSKLLFQILETHEFREKTEAINCEIFTHIVDLNTGDWHIIQPLI